MAEPGMQCHSENVIDKRGCHRTMLVASRHPTWDVYEQFLVPFIQSLSSGTNGSHIHLVHIAQVCGQDRLVCHASAHAQIKPLLSLMLCVWCHTPGSPVFSVCNIGKLGWPGDEAIDQQCGVIICCQRDTIPQWCPYETSVKHIQDTWI